MPETTSEEAAAGCRGLAVVPARRNETNPRVAIARPAMAKPAPIKRPAGNANPKAAANRAAARIATPRKTTMTNGGTLSSRARMAGIRFEAAPGRELAQPAIRALSRNDAVAVEELFHAKTDQAHPRGQREPGYHFTFRWDSIFGSQSTFSTSWSALVPLGVRNSAFLTHRSAPGTPASVAKVSQDWRRWRRRQFLEDSGGTCMMRPLPRPL